MDEQRLSRLFRDAVGEPPPASFGAEDVLAASRRASTRQRHALAGGLLLGVGVLSGGLVGGGVLSSGVVGGGVGGDSRQVPSGETATTSLTEPETDARAVESRTPRLLGVPPGPGAPGLLAGSVEGRSGSCGPVDHELVAEVTSVLADRGITVSGPAAGISEPCPAGSRAAVVPVPGGTLYVLLLREAAQSSRVEVVTPDGERGYSLMLADGRGLTVISKPAAPGEPAPLADELPEWTRELAGRL